MARNLSDEERGRLNRQIADAEKRTNAQIVLSVIQRCDNYAELPWKAFALGASVAGLLVFILDLFLFYWMTNAIVLIAVASLLVAGAIFALLAVFIPAFARMFLSADRTETEVRQYAESVFLNRGLFATTGRTGILLLVSLFERRVIILPDKGLSGRLGKDDMQQIIGQMAGLLSRNETFRAMETGLQQLTAALESSSGSAAANKNELPDDIIEEKGV